MSDLLGEKMAAELKKFADCSHENWKCLGCGCVTDRGCVASPERAQINQMEETIEQLKKDNDQLKKDLEGGRNE